MVVSLVRVCLSSNTLHLYVIQDRLYVFDSDLSAGSRIQD